jgi:hypothetical protein
MGAFRRIGGSLAGIIAKADAAQVTPCAGFCNAAKSGSLAIDTLHRTFLSQRSIFGEAESGCGRASLRWATLLFDTAETSIGRRSASAVR